MDGMGGEVSNKIRSAIKAKLMELGAYVDDELPDYIMVMVANKRSKQQMDDDLQLFLGDSTATFTAWLHSVLNKLQQVSINTNESKISDPKKRALPDDPKKDKKKKVKKEKDLEKSPEKGKVRDKDKEKIFPKSSDESNKIKAADTLKHVESEPRCDLPVKEKRSSDIHESFQRIRTGLSGKKQDDKIIEDEDQDFINLKVDVEGDMWGETDECLPTANKSQVLQVAIASPLPSTAVHTSATSSKPACKENLDSSASVKISVPKAPEPKPVPRIIKISEALRQEQESLNPIKHPADPQALVKRVLLSHVVNQKITQVSNVRRVDRSHEKVSRRTDRKDHQDLRQTLNQERRRERERANNPVDWRDRSKESGKGREWKRLKASVGDPRPQSSVASVVCVKSHLAGKDEEDEKSPDISIASVVHVKPRPKIPAALQANRSLILKAVAEAQKSVHRAPLRPDPALKISTKDLKAKNNLNSAVASNAIIRAQKLERALSNESKLKRQLPKEKERMSVSGRLPPREKLKQMKMSVTVPTHSVTQQISMDVHEESEDGSVNIGSPLNIMVQVPASPLAQAANPAQTEKVLRWMEGVEEANKSEVLSHSNGTPEEPSSAAGNDLLRDYVEIGTDGNNLLSINEEVLEPEFVREASNDTSLDVAAVSQWSDDEDPQFVVTLDGLDPDFIETFEKEENVSEEVNKTVGTPPKVTEVEQHQQEQEMHLREELLKQQAVNRENQMRQELLKQQASAKERKAAAAKTTASMPKDKVTLKRPASPASADAPSCKVVVKSSTPERCKFWPTCRHGDKCEFYHPTVPCKLFPKCKFADRCLYIHPTCRFNSSCTRMDCPYTHFGPRGAGSCPSPAVTHPNGQTIKQACKFYPNCNNRNCLFIHPTVCRFGTHCTRLKCQFIHSDKTLPTKHKWVRA